MTPPDDASAIDDATAAAAFRRLLAHLAHRSDVQNVDLMGLAGFCRNCLGDWVSEASQDGERPLGREAARHAVYGISYEEWKSRHQQPATAEQLARMAASVAKNRATDGGVPPAANEPGR